MVKKSVVIIDDERLARQELKKLLLDFPDYVVVAEASNAAEGVRFINEFDPDLVFLDIQMPDKTGFEMLEEVERMPPVIFTTAYDEHALKAFEFNALDYLLKPIDTARFTDAIHRFENTEKKDADPTSPNMNVHRGSLGEEDQVFVRDGDRCWFVRLADIRLFESAGNYAKVFFGTNKPLILKSLNALEDRLDHHVFFRANRKHIVNLRMIERVEPYFNGGLLLEIRGGERVEVSRRQSVRFKEMMSL
jgi:two-component system LytT family response regulator